ncbi:CU044_5270 family protein, partial [Streptosporangium sp. NPDC003464]
PRRAPPAGTGPGRWSAPGWDGRRPGGRERGPRRWTAVGVGLAAAVLAVAAVLPSDGLTVISPDPSASSSDLPGAGPTARQILLAAATAVAKAPSEGAYWRTRTVTGQLIVAPDRHYLIRRRSSRETWLAQRPGGQSWWIDRYLGARPATPRDEAAWRAAGSPGDWLYPADVRDLGDVRSGEKVDGSPGEPTVSRLRGKWKGSGGLLTKDLLTWAELRAVPSGPEELRAYLEARIVRYAEKYGGMDLEREMETRLQGSCMEILSGLPVSSEVRASAYQILASLPGMRAEGEVTDPLGRTGQALSYGVDRRGGEAGGGRFVIDPDSGLPLAEETRSVGRLADDRTVEVGSFTAYEEIGWTDEEPDLPDLKEPSSEEPVPAGSGPEGPDLDKQDLERPDPEGAGPDRSGPEGSPLSVERE